MIKIASATGFTDEEMQYLNDAVNRANVVILTPEFSKAILNFTNSAGGLGFMNTEKTAVQILADLLNHDYAVDFSIQSYPWWMAWKRKEVAHEDASGVTFNRKFFDYESIHEHVDTVVHETMHQAGYSHVSASQWDSVPYGFGDTAGDISEELSS